MTKTTFKVVKRSEAKAKHLRRQGILPANIYIPKKESIALEMDPINFAKLYKEVGETGLIYLNIEGESKAIPVLIDQVDMDYLGSNFEHVVFRGVNLKEKITANVPVEVVGEFDVPEAVLITVQNEVEVEALPADLPEKFVFDVSKLKMIGDSFTMADLDFDQEKVELVLSEEDDPHERVLVSVQAQEEEEVEEVAEELAEPELVGEEDGSDKTDATQEATGEKTTSDKPADETPESSNQENT
jgi:large subunit ribosomal protein L25